MDDFRDHDVCEKWSFFQVINHGVPCEEKQRMEKVVKTFFNLPVEEKMKVKKGQGGSNRVS